MPSEGDPTDPRGRLVTRHLRFGWWTLLAFTVLGLGLESAHGLKLGWYLRPASEARRLVLTLAHAHGTILALVNISFAQYLRAHDSIELRFVPTASWTLLAGTVLLPLGFFVGGFVVHGSDPSIGAWLIPPGAILLILALYFIARSVGPSSR